MSTNPRTERPLPAAAPQQQQGAAPRAPEQAAALPVPRALLRGASAGDVPLTPRDVLRLQRTVGNRAVLQLLAKRNGPRPAPPGAPRDERAASPTPASASGAPGPASIQRKVGFEFETGIAVRNLETENAPPAKQPFYLAEKWHIEPDAGNMEFVTAPLASSDEVFATVGEITEWVRDLQALEHSLPSEQEELIEKNLQKKEEAVRSREEQQKRAETLNESEVATRAAEKFGVPLPEAQGWVAKYGLLAVDDVTRDEKITRELVPFLKSLLEMTAGNLNVSPESFDQDNREIVEGYQYRKLADMPLKGLLADDDLAAFGSLDRVTAAPQATMGVTLEKLETAMLLIPWKKVYTGLNTPQEAEHTLSSMNPADGELLVRAREGARKLSAGLRPALGGAVTEQEWRQFEGLVALVASYAMKGNAPRNSAFKDAKEIAPLMSRLNFSAMFSVLPESLREMFTPANVAAAAGIAADAPVFGPKGFGKGQKGPTLGEWVASIAEGTDVMSAIGETTVTDEKVGGSPSMGEFEEFDKSDPRAPEGLVPLELRRLSKGADVADWEMLAYQIFVFAEALQEMEP